jgi:hypothetical protein
MSNAEDNPEEHQVKRKLSPLVKWLIAALIIYLIIQGALSNQFAPC